MEKFTYKPLTHLYFFPSGNVAAFDDRGQVPEIQAKNLIEEAMREFIRLELIADDTDVQAPGWPSTGKEWKELIEKRKSVED